MINVTPLLGDPRDVLEAVGARRRARAAGAKPVLAVMMAVEAFYDAAQGAHRPAAGLSLPRVGGARARAARALRASGGGGRTDEAPRRASTSTTRDDRARRSRAPGADGYLDAGDAFRLLEALRHPGRAAGRCAADRAEALAAARRDRLPGGGEGDLARPGAQERGEGDRARPRATRPTVAARLRRAGASASPPPGSPSTASSSRRWRAAGTR